MHLIKYLKLNKLLKKQNKTYSFWEPPEFNNFFLRFGSDVEALRALATATSLSWLLNITVSSSEFYEIRLTEVEGILAICLRSSWFSVDFLKFLFFLVFRTWHFRLVYTTLDFNLNTWKLGGFFGQRIIRTGFDHVEVQTVKHEIRKK